MTDAFISLAIIDASAIFDYFVANAGYLLVFALMVVESSFIPFPSEVVVPPAAYLACAKGDMHLAGIIGVATAGAICGAIINYSLSLWIGRPLVYRFADSRFGHACLIDRAKVEHAEAYLDRHGSVSTFLGRLIPAVRQLISIPAGLARMHIGKFVIFTGLGALIWNCVLVALGWWLSTQVSLDELYDAVERYNSLISYAILAVVAVVVIFILYNAFRKKK